MRLLAYLVLPLAAVVAFLLFWPVRINPVAWTPPELDESRYPENSLLSAVERLAEGIGIGPEGLALDEDGRIYAGYEDGRVMMFNPNGTGEVLLANTGGRPLGLAIAPNGGVVVADAIKGLLIVGAQGSQQVLSTEAEGLPFKFVDDVDLNAAGDKYYFSDASHRFGVHEVMADIFEHGANGRLLEYDVASATTTVLLRDLHFANGVAVGPDDAYILVNETTRYRVLRYWLKGEKAGTSEVFIDNLPGFPDNISFNGSDRFWLALYAPRTSALDALLPNPALRKILFRLPKFMQPGPAMHGWVLGLDLDGRVVADLQDKQRGAYAPITSAEQFGDALYLGSLSAPAIGRLPLTAIPSPP